MFHTIFHRSDGEFYVGHAWSEFALVGNQCVITFPSTHYALRAEKLLKDAHMEIALVPVPRHISSDCGICVELDCEVAERAMQILQNQGVKYEGLHKVANEPRDTLLARLLSRVNLKNILR